MAFQHLKAYYFRDNWADCITPYRFTFISSPHPVLLITPFLTLLLSRCLHLLAHLDGTHLIQCLQCEQARGERSISSQVYLEGLAVLHWCQYLPLLMLWSCQSWWSDDHKWHCGSCVWKHCRDRTLIIGLSNSTSHNLRFCSLSIFRAFAASNSASYSLAAHSFAISWSST